MAKIKVTCTKEGLVLEQEQCRGPGELIRMDWDQVDLMNEFISQVMPITGGSYAFTELTEEAVYGTRHVPCDGDRLVPDHSG